MDITAVQKILSDAIKEYALVGNVPAEALIAFISVDIYRKLTVKATAPRPPARRNALAGDKP
jgi:hypothetical protein